MIILTWIITFSIVVGLGIYSGKSIKSANQWTGGDKSMGAISIGCIFAAWQIGGMAIVGAAQNGYNLGISGAWYSIAGSFYFIALAFFAKTIRTKMPGESVPSYLQTRFDKKTAKLYSIAWIIYGFFYIPIQLKTVSSIISIVIPNVNLTIAMIIGLTLAVLYTSFSGMRGADTVGRIVCIGIYILLIIFVFTNLKRFEGYGGLLTELPSEYSSMTNMPIQRIIAWIFGGCISTAVMQSVLQPLLAAKNPEAAQKGSVIGYFIAAPICFFTALCGMMAKASGVSLGDGSTAFAYSIDLFSSPLFAGIIFAFTTLIISATMATMMLATGTIITNIYKTDINPNASDDKILKTSKIVTFIFAYLTLIPAFLIPSDSLTNLFLTLQHVAAAPVSFSIIVGLTWHKATKQAAFWSMLLGIIVGISWMLLGLTDKVEAIYPVFLTTYLVGFIVSKLTYKEEIEYINE